MAVISLTSLQRYCYATIAVAVLALGAVGEESAEAERAKADFQVNYGAALDAIAKDDWPGAQVLLESALTKLGKHEHPDKAKAKAILAKAKRTNAQRREMATALQTAQELLRQQQWADAIAMFKKAKELGADPEVVARGIQKAEAGTGEADYKKHLADGMASLGLEDWASAERAFVKALATKPGDPAAMKGLKEARAKLAAGKTPEPAQPKDTSATPTVPTPTKPTPAETTPATPAVAVRKPIPLPVPVQLDRGQWERGAGSDCYWAGSLLHLEEGDEKFRLPLTGEFAAQIAVEARMDHRSRIYLDLRPAKKKQAPVVRGYGSKEGSAPFLQVDKKVCGRGSAQPQRKRIVLGIRRTGGQIEFFCDGRKIGETFDVPADAALWLWVCGKGYMYAGKVVCR